MHISQQTPTSIELQRHCIEGVLALKRLLQRRSGSKPL
jgi:hypothetical protein